MRLLPLAATIALAHPVRNVQGCAFDTATTLVCSTNDPRPDLWGIARQLLTIRLARPLDGRPVLGTPSVLGPVPTVTTSPLWCPGLGETEGIDIYGNRMLVAVNVPCAALAQLCTFARSDARSGDTDAPMRWSTTQLSETTAAPGRPKPASLTRPAPGRTPS